MRHKVRLIVTMLVAVEAPTHLIQQPSSLEGLS